MTTTDATAGQAPATPTSPPASPAVPPAAPAIPAAAAAPPAAEGDGQGDDTGRPPRSGMETAGNIIMWAAIGGAAIAAVDVLSGGKLLGPLFAWIARGRAPAAAEAAEPALNGAEPGGQAPE